MSDKKLSQEGKIIAFRERLASMDEAQVLCAEAKVREEVELGFLMLEAIDKRLEYLESITPENCTIRAKRLEIQPPQESD